ncbi:MAG: sugar kinase [Thermoplasmata archaeon]|nr:MAG: sugar kinase [Thermoplasmata archaeon]
MKWGIICKPDEKSFRIGKEIYELLDDAIIEKKLAEYLGKDGHTIEEVGKIADKIVVIGGDGTILLTLQHTTNPIFSINTGRIGFLAEIDASNAINGMKKVLEGEYFVEERIKIASYLNGSRLEDAANEVALHISNIGKLLMTKLYIDGELAENIYGDGMIIATPMGSTSYALSVGGPIVDPTLHVFVVAPLAPFRHIASPLVMPADKKIGIGVDKPSKIAIDGIGEYDFQAGDMLEIEKSKNVARFVKLKNTFYSRLYKKLSFRMPEIK